MQVLRSDAGEQLVERVLVRPGAKQQAAVDESHGQLGAFFKAQVFRNGARNADGQTVAPAADLCLHVLSLLDGYTQDIREKRRRKVIARPSPPLPTPCPGRPQGAP